MGSLRVSGITDLTFLKSCSGVFPWQWPASRDQGTKISSICPGAPGAIDPVYSCGLSHRCGLQVLPIRRSCNQRTRRVGDRDRGGCHRTSPHPRAKARCPLPGGEGSRAPRPTSPPVRDVSTPPAAALNMQPPLPPAPPRALLRTCGLRALGIPAGAGMTEAAPRVGFTLTRRCAAAHSASSGQALSLKGEVGCEVAR